MKEEIKLEFNRKHFEEVYFQKNQGSYVKGYVTKPAFVRMIIFTIVCSAILVLKPDRESFDPSKVICIILIIIFVMLYLRVAYSLWKWKNQIKQFLDELEKEKNFRLAINENSFSVISDSKTTIENWANVNKVEIKENSTTLFTSTQIYLFPKKSMSNNDFDKFNSIVQEKLE